MKDKEYRGMTLLEIAKEYRLRVLIADMRIKFLESLDHSKMTMH